MSWLGSLGKKGEDNVESQGEPEVEDIESVDDIELVEESGEGQVEAEKSDSTELAVRSTPEAEVPATGQIQPSQPVSDDDSGMELGEETNATSVIKGTACGVDGKFSLNMISKLNNPKAITSVALVADFSESLGLKGRAEFRRKFLNYHLQNLVAVKGECAEKLLEALNIQVNADFEKEKRKGIGEQML